MMTDNEKKLLKEELQQCSNYLEWGSGNSTKLAASCSNIKTITTVESDIQFWEKNVGNDLFVQKAMQDNRLSLLFSNLGKVTFWGTPKNKKHKNDWPKYAHVPFSDNKTIYDLLLIDGRFRIACVLNACLHLAPGTKILIHDFYVRPHYFKVLKFITEIGKTETMGLFTINSNNDRKAILSLLKKYQYIPCDRSKLAQEICRFRRLSRKFINRFLPKKYQLCTYKLSA